LARNQFIAFLAILGLYLQLAAGALCLTGVASGADPFAAPICHGAAEQSSSKTDHTPVQQQHSCPFCAVHCHAALLMPLAILFASPFAIVRLREVLRHVAQPQLRFAIAAQPRGPPLHA
jgi:hypothetical protein